MIGFIDDHRVAHGVSAICRMLPIAPSTYYACLAVRADPSKASARQQRDAVLRPKIQKVWDDNWKVYGALAALLRRTVTRDVDLKEVASLLVELDAKADKV